MDVAVQDLVANGPNRHPFVRAIPDIETIHNVIVAINVNAHVAIGAVLAVNDGRATVLGPEHNRAGSGSASAEVKAPSGLVVGIGARLDDDGSARLGQTV